MAKLNKAEQEMLKKIVYAKHIHGLPISEGSELYIYYDENGLLFNYNDNVFGLGYDVIIDLSVRTDKEIRSNLVSSAGGAVAGGMLLGPLGAAIGGRTKNVKTSSEIKYLIITYIKGGEYTHIGFELPMGNHFLVNPALVNGLNNEVKWKLCTATKTTAIDLSKSGSEAEEIISNYKVDIELGRKVRAVAINHEQIKIKGGKTGCGVVFFVLFIMMAIFAAGVTSSPTYNTTNETANSNGTQIPNTVFNAPMYINHTEKRTFTEQEIRNVLGEPDSVEDWTYTDALGVDYPIRTMYYGDVEYKFNNNYLVRVTLWKPYSFNSTNDLLTMFGCRKYANTTINDTGSAFRAYNCGVNDLWIGYENGVTTWVHISYHDLFG